MSRDFYHGSKFGGVTTCWACKQPGGTLKNTMIDGPEGTPMQVIIHAACEDRVADMLIKAAYRRGDIAPPVVITLTKEEGIPYPSTKSPSSVEVQGT